MNRRMIVVPVFAALVASSLLTFMPAAFAAATQEKTKSAKPLHVSKGERVKLADYMVPGKITVFDFYSDYCGPCVQVAPALDELHRKRGDIVVVKVDINRPGMKRIDFSSPVAQQYALRSIPHFKVYGPDGKLLADDAEGGQKARRMVMGWIQ